MAVPIELIKDSHANLDKTAAKELVRKSFSWSQPFSPLTTIKENEVSKEAVDNLKQLGNINGTLLMEVILDTPLEGNASRIATLRIIDRQDVLEKSLKQVARSEADKFNLQVSLKVEENVLLFDSFKWSKEKEVSELLSTLSVAPDDPTFQKLKDGCDNVQVSISVVIPEPEAESSQLARDPVAKVLETPELLQNILSLVVGPGSKSAVKTVSSVNHFWRESTCKVLQSKGRPFHHVTPYHPWWSDSAEFTADAFPLGYTLPISTAVLTEADARDANTKTFLKLHGRSIVELDFTYTRAVDDNGKDSFLDGLEFPNLHTLNYRLEVVPSEATFKLLEGLFNGVTNLKRFNYSDYIRDPGNLRLTVQLPESLKVFKLTTTSHQTIGTFLNSDKPPPTLKAFSLVSRLSRIPSRAVPINQAVTKFLKGTSSSLKICLIKINPRGPDMELTIPRMSQLEGLSLDNIVLEKVDYSDNGLPNLKHLQLINCGPRSVNKFFSQSLPKYPGIRLFSYRNNDFEKGELDETQMQVISQCLPNCVCLTVTFFSSKVAALGMALVFLGMPQLRKLTLIMNKTYALGSDGHPGDLDFILTGIPAEANWMQIRSKPECWRKLCLDFTGITNLKDLKHLVIQGPVGIGRPLQVTEFVFQTCLFAMPGLKIVELIAFEHLMNTKFHKAMTSMGKRLVQHPTPTTRSDDSDVSCSSDWEDDYVEGGTLWR